VELRDGRITMLANDDGMDIEVHDCDAAITFVRIHLNPVQLAQALSRLEYTRCEKLEVFGLKKIGKVMWR
jgi:hypothetical protein